MNIDKKLDKGVYRMLKERIKIEQIPAVIWGETSDKVIVAVHGNMSHKEDTVIELLAKEAVRKGYQVLSFDLPEHGDRQEQQDKACQQDGNLDENRQDYPDVTKVETYIDELKSIMQEAQKRWKHISLFACSMGAYFSLMSYQDVALDKVFFLSPLVSMQALIEGVMQGFGISEERLKKEQTIETPIGMKLYWSYYSYVKAHPTITFEATQQGNLQAESKIGFDWQHPTYILYGQKDEMCPQNIVEAFTQKHQCQLTIEPKAEHYFHTNEQLAAYKQWLKENI